MSEKKAINQQSSSEKLGTAPMLPLIAKMSLPSMFSMLIQACYNVVDSIYVSRLGDSALSAVSLVYPIQLLTIAVGVGTSVGLSSLISRRLGEKRKEEAQAAADHGMFLCIIHWVIFLLFGIFGSRPFCMAFSENPALINPATDYCAICCIGSLFAMTASSMEKIMQASGNMMAPMWCMIVGAVTNIILDPIMIFGYLGCPALGVAGAAYATVIGQAMTFIVAIIFMYTKHLDVKVSFKLFKLQGKTIKDIYQVGLPSMVMQAIGSLTTLLLNAILITFSETAVAILGVYFKLQSFVFMPVFGMNHGLMPIMGYNYGARNRKRLMDAYKLGTLIALTIMVIGMFLFKLFHGTLMGFFNAEGELLEYGMDALRIISWNFPIAAVCIICGTMFQATAHGINMLIVSLLRQLVAIVPLAYLFSKVFEMGVKGVWLAYPCAEIVSLIFSLFLFVRLYRREIKDM